MTELIQPIARAMFAYLETPFAFFGHSVGGLICFELARALRRHHGLLPSQLFISGAPAPHLSRTEEPMHNLPTSELLTKLRDLNGTPKEVLENSEVMQLMLPILRADFSLKETYTYNEEPSLECPISVFGGLEDPQTSQADLEGWRVHTSAAFSLELLPGGHFFLHTDEADLLQRMSQRLELAC